MQTIKNTQSIVNRCLHQSGSSNNDDLAMAQPTLLVSKNSHMKYAVLHEHAGELLYWTINILSRTLSIIALEFKNIECYYKKGNNLLELMS